MNGNNNKCKGCHSREVDNCIFLIPPYRYEAEIDNCPCMICIVKMVCRQICPPRASFRARAEMKRGNIKYEQYN